MVVAATWAWYPAAATRRGSTRRGLAAVKLRPPRAGVRKGRKSRKAGRLRRWKGASTSRSSPPTETVTGPELRSMSRSAAGSRPKGSRSRSQALPIPSTRKRTSPSSPAE